MTTAALAPLAEGDRRELLRIARITLKEYLRFARVPPGAPHHPALLSPYQFFSPLYGLLYRPLGAAIFATTRVSHSL